jgi:GTPase SAR1 family protein
MKTKLAYKEAISKQPGLFSGRKEPQTIGIEVQVIVEDHVQIAIWDLAGHEEFHSFHDLVVPNLSTQGSACSFVLLSDISSSRDGGSGSKYELKALEEIDQELRYWLRFIASNTRQSLMLLPHVTVIFTLRQIPKGGSD